MIWTVHEKPGAPTRVVPDAKAKWAIVFGSLWLLRHRLWWEAPVFLLLTLTVGRLTDIALEATPNAVLLTLSLTLLPRLWLLLEGNEMRRARLERQGYAFVGVVEADDEQGALLKTRLAAPRPVPDYADPALARSS